MTHKVSGFIFMLTLSVIAIISLLLLSAMQQLMLYQRSASTRNLTHQGLYQLEDVAGQLINLSRIDKACVKAQDKANGIMQVLLHHKGCLFVSGQSHYRYLFEDLGDFPCLVEAQDGVLRSTHHLRLSLLLVSDDDMPPKVLQIRVIQKGVRATCLNTPHEVHLGLSSWRYISTALESGRS